MNPTAPLSTFPSSFENPYEHVPVKDICRTTINLSQRDLNRLRSVHGRVGFMQTTINILFYKLYHELDRLGIIPDYNPDLYEHYVANAGILLYDSKGRPIATTGSPCVPIRADGGGKGADRVGGVVAHTSPDAKAPLADDQRGTVVLAPIAGGVTQSPDSRGPSAVAGPEGRVRRKRTKG